MAKKRSKEDPAGPLVDGTAGQAIDVQDTTPPVVTEPDPRAEDEVKPENVLSPDEWHSQEDIEFALGIPPQTTRVAFDNGAFGQHKSEGGYLQLFGREVLDWIKREAVEHAVTDEAASLYHRLHKAPPAAEPKPKTETMLDRALDVIDSREKAEADDEERWRRDATRCYLAVLLADDTSGKTPMTLADLMQDLKLSAEQVEADRRLVARAQESEALILRQEEIHQEHLEAGQALKDLLKRHEIEERETRVRAHNAARSWGEVVVHAPSLLRELARKRPGFFDDSTDPPRLFNPTNAE